MIFLGIYMAMFVLSASKYFDEPKDIKKIVLLPQLFWFFENIQI